MCTYLNTKELKGHALKAECKKARHSSNPIYPSQCECTFYGNSDKAEVGYEPRDIEELHRLAKSLLDKKEGKEFCPYYKMRSMAKGADIVFMPYNYVIDPAVRHGMQEIFDDAVIIFDEAHNVISVAEESQSFSIDSTKL
jgi:regulator of telomere elongation helicase 1